MHETGIYCTAHCPPLVKAVHLIGTLQGLLAGDLRRCHRQLGERKMQGRQAGCRKVSLQIQAQTLQGERPNGLFAGLGGAEVFPISQVPCPANNRYPLEAEDG